MGMTDQTGQLQGILGSLFGGGTQTAGTPAPTPAPPGNPAAGRPSFDWSGLGGVLPLAGYTGQPSYTTPAPATSGSWWENWKPGNAIAPGAPGTTPGSAPAKTSTGSKSGSNNSKSSAALKNGGYRQVLGRVAHGNQRDGFY